MALIKCPECEREISDQAVTCPHCGNPIAVTKSAAKPSFINNFVNIAKDLWTKIEDNTKPWMRVAGIAVIIVAVILVSLLGSSVAFKKNFAEFQAKYEETLIPILNENELRLISVEYTELVPDYEKDYYEINRINEYEVKVFIVGDIDDYERLYDIIIDIRCANNYLLSNTYEIMSNGAYVDDDCKETGFHEVHTTLIFEDNTSYKINFRSLLKNGETVWEQGQKPVTEESMVNQADAAGWDCMYEDCDSPRAEGRLFCHIHKCNEPGCMHETSPLQSYCEQHRND